MPSALICLQIQVEMTPARCTTGPSRPDEPPEDRVMKEASAEASPARISSRPSFIAAPSMASATDRTRPSSVKRCRISPTTSPPKTGISRIRYQGKDSAKECSRRTSSVPYSSDCSPLMPRRNRTAAKPATMPISRAINQNCTCPGPRRRSTRHPSRQAVMACSNGPVRWDRSGLGIGASDDGSFCLSHGIGGEKGGCGKREQSGLNCALPMIRRPGSRRIVDGLCSAMACRARANASTAAIRPVRRR